VLALLLSDGSFVIAMTSQRNKILPEAVISSRQMTAAKVDTTESSAIQLQVKTEGKSLLP